jgi:hypothetical protein
MEKAPKHYMPKIVKDYTKEKKNTQEMPGSLNVPSRQEKPGIFTPVENRVAQ